MPATDKKAKIGIFGASGYTGAELVRLLLRHPRAELALLTADRRAGKSMAEVFPQFAPYHLPTLAALDADIDDLGGPVVDDDPVLAVGAEADRLAVDQRRSQKGVAVDPR